MAARSHTKVNNILQQACSSSDSFQTFDSLLEDACNAAAHSGTSLGVPAECPAASEVAMSIPLSKSSAEFRLGASAVANRSIYVRGLKRPASMNQNAGIKTRCFAAGSPRDQPLSPSSPTSTCAVNVTGTTLSSRCPGSGSMSASKGALLVPLRSVQSAQPVAAEFAAGTILPRTPSVPAIVASSSIRRADVSRAPRRRPRADKVTSPDSLDDVAVADFLSVGCWNEMALPGDGPARDHALDKASQALGLGLSDHQARSQTNQSSRCCCRKDQSDEASAFAHSSSNCVATAFVELGAQL
jgi:hypothetical protein